MISLPATGLNPSACLYLLAPRFGVCSISDSLLFQYLTLPPEAELSCVQPNLKSLQRCSHDGKVLELLGQEELLGLFETPLRHDFSSHDVVNCSEAKCAHLQGLLDGQVNVKAGSALVVGASSEQIKVVCQGCPLDKDCTSANIEQKQEEANVLLREFEAQKAQLHAIRAEVGKLEQTQEMDALHGLAIYGGQMRSVRLADEQGFVASSSADIAALEKALNRLGHSGWRPLQLGACCAAVDGCNVVLNIPTGRCASFCLKHPMPPRTFA